MRWLVHGTLPTAVSEALTRHKHTAVLPAAISLAEDAPPSVVLAAARKSQLDLITADDAIITAALGDSHRLSRSVVHLQLDAGELEYDDAIDRLLTRYSRLSPDRLYTVTNTRVKVRQLPTKRVFSE